MKKTALWFFGLLVLSCTPPSDSGSISPPVTSDTTVPVTTDSLTVSSITVTGATFSWLAASDNITKPSELSYKLVLGSTSAELDSVAEADGITGSLRVLDWTVNVAQATASGLTLNTTYWAALLVKDGAGNKSLYPLKSLTTSSDGTPPVVGTAIVSSGVSANSLSLSWGVASDGVTPQPQLQYKVVQASTLGAIDTVSEALAAPLTVQDWTPALVTASVQGLAAGTDYYFAILVRDASSNASLYAPLLVQTTSTVDTTSPIPGTVLGSSSITASSATISWGQGSDNVTTAGFLKYRLVRASSASEIDTIGEVSALSGVGLVQDWTDGITSKAVSGLSSGTTYFFGVAVKDASGNGAVYAPLQVLTLADTTPPSVSGSVVAPSTTGSTADLTWTQATDTETPQGQLKYKVVMASDTAALDTLAEAQGATDKSGGWQTGIGGFTVTGLSTVTTYAFAVLVQDAGSNEALIPPVLMETTTSNVYPHEPRIGFNYPPTGTFSVVDLNGTAPGRSWSTQTWPLGAHYNASDLEVAVWAPHATKLLLEIYNREHYWATDRIAGLPAPKDGQAQAVYDYWLSKGSDGVWRGKIKGAGAHVNAGVLYGFRVWGPNWPYDNAWTRGNSSAGYIKDWQSSGYPPVMHRFNPNKVLTDPYSYELSHDTEYPAMKTAGETGGIYGTGGTDSKDFGGASISSTYSGPISTGGISKNRREVDTGRFVSKSYALNLSNYTGNAKPNVPEKDLIVYEAHVRGLTKHPSSSNLTTILSGMADFANVPNVPAAYRGTYKGAGYLAKYFKALGINAVELLPVHETRNDLNDSYTGTGSNPGNYWGYMTYSFFAPDRNYAYDKSPGGPSREFQDMVSAFAAEGVEIWIDVVYNHSGEGGNWGSPDITGFTSYGGFGASDYYHINKDNAGGLVDGATGCGNQLNFSEGRTETHNLVKDSLTHFIDKLGVSGFRFDLAAVLARDTDSVANDGNYWTNVGGVKASGGVITHSLPISIATLGSTKNAKMVAETWDMWAYPVGMYPAGWMEWNGRYRDATRKFLKGDTSGHDGVSPNDAFNGDWAHYNDNGGPQKTVNFIVAHDGFTLADLVSYNNKTNTSRLWPFGASDGGADGNESWASQITPGTYGISNTEAFRRQRIRNLYTWQMFSRGTPMIVWGDEFGRTQNGNNNPYNLDSVATWNNYDFIGRNDPQGASTGVSGEGYSNNLGSDTKLDGKNNLFLFAKEIMNLRLADPVLRSSDYNVGFTYTKEDGVTPQESTNRARMIRIGESYVICINMFTEEIQFTRPTPPSGKVWKRIIDTAAWAEGDGDSVGGNFWSASGTGTMTWSSGTYGVKPWAITVFKAN